MYRGWDNVNSNLRKKRSQSSPEQLIVALKVSGRWDFDFSVTVRGVAPVNRWAPSPLRFKSIPLCAH